MITRWLGLVPYGEALAAQRAYREEVVAGAAPEALWGLEHPPVLTTGRRVVGDLPEAAALERAGYALHLTERGGLATCHEPGQLVVYLLVGIRACGVRRAVAAVEDAVIDWLGARSVVAGRREGAPGIWIGGDKVCAVGLHVSRGVTMHGLALNLVNDLRGFGLITPCGIRDGGITSLARVAGRAPTPEVAWPSIAAALSASLASVGVGLGDRGGGLDGSQASA